MRKTFLARPDAVPAARSAAQGCVRELGGEESLAHAVGLVVTEACSNVVVHAYRGREEPGLMTVAIENPGAVLRISVRDNGIGLVPRVDSPGLGMGLPLMSQLADSLELRTLPQGGSEVRMHFDLTPEHATA